MKKSQVRFTVFFEAPFWYGLYERQEGQQTEAAKVIFGAEPKDGEVLDFLLRKEKTLCFGKVMGEKPKEKRKNPKRLQREIHQQTGEIGIGTKAQQALAALREQQRAERKVRTKEEKLAEAERRFRQRQEKRREKHWGH